MVKWFDFDMNTSQDLRIANAYLTLPCRKVVHTMNVRELCAGYPEEMYSCDAECSSFTVIDPEMLVLTEEKAKRFPRAMRSLGLGPHLNPSQIPSLDRGHPEPIFKEAAKETKKEKKEEESKNFPQSIKPEDFKIAIQARLRGMPIKNITV